MRLATASPVSATDILYGQGAFGAQKMKEQRSFKFTPSWSQTLRIWAGGLGRTDMLPSMNFAAMQWPLVWKVRRTEQFQIPMTMVPNSWTQGEGLARLRCCRQWRSGPQHAKRQQFIDSRFRRAFFPTPRGAAGSLLWTVVKARWP